MANEIKSSELKTPHLVNCKYLSLEILNLEANVLSKNANTARKC